MKSAELPPVGCGLDLERIERAVAETRFAGRVRHFTSVTSTNQLAIEAAQAGVLEGIWAADEQTAGRGRGGHVWHSAPGDGLYVSALVRPQLGVERALWLSLATGLAAQAAIRETTGLRPDLRWPNDLILAERKCGGILVETAAAAGGGSLRYAVIGVGINVNHAAFPAELDALATSLRLEAGSEFRRDEVLVRLLVGLDREIASLERRDSDLLARFAAASSWVAGKRVRVGERDGYTGVTRGLDADGFLRVEDDGGTMRTVLSGGVRPAA